MLSLMKKYFAFCNEENRRKYHIAIVLGIVNSFVSLLRVAAAYLVISNLIADTLSMAIAWEALGIIVASIVASTLVSMKSTMLQTEAGYDTAAVKRIEIAEHLRYLPMGYFNENVLGHITATATTSMEQLANAGTRVVMITTKGYATTAVIIVVLFFFDVRIAAIATLGTAISLGLSALMQQANSGVSEKRLHADDAMTSKVLEFVQGIAEVKGFNLASSTITQVDEAVQHASDLNFRMEAISEVFIFAQWVFNKLTGVVVCLASSMFYLDGSLSLEYTIMMIICSFMIFESLDSAGSFSALFQTVSLIVDKANEILETPTMDIDGEEIEPASHDLAAQGISFAYTDRTGKRGRTIVDDVSLVIPERTSCALVGPSGGGKTTLTHLLARFWDVDEGNVKLSGIDVRNYSYDALMRNFSFVFQSVYLFNDTVANNIRFGRPDASMDEVMAAAKKACCHDFIMGLPDGYETMVGEGGATLSGGERQRVSIARAIMKDSPIIVLDEATANVDPENEVSLMRAIAELTREKTVVMIAHRLKTVRGADQILVIDQGKIAQRGNHGELSRVDGIYKRFVESREQAASWKL